MNFKLRSIADSLFEAEISMVPINPISDTFKELTSDECYEIQKVNIDRKCFAGDFITGYKIGLTSHDAMKQYHTDEPDYGYLLGSMRITDKTVLKIDELIQPKLECEIAFVMNGAPFSENMLLDEFKQNIKFVSSSYEIVDSRIVDWRVNTLADTIADNGCAGMYFLGRKRLPVGELKFDSIDVKLSVNGEIMRAGNSRVVYGSPLKALYWLAEKLYHRGIQLKEDQVVLSGTVTSTVALQKGKIYTTEFNGLETLSLKYF